MACKALGKKASKDKVEAALRCKAHRDDVVSRADIVSRLDWERMSQVERVLVASSWCTGSGKHIWGAHFTPSINFLSECISELSKSINRAVNASVN